MTATLEQENIINADGNIVTVARPGSGKTFVLAEKIKKILPTLKDFEGIIAISFTNKASNELKERSLSNGVNKKESFFGTIHKFYISEIILSFGKQVFGLPQNKIEIVDYNQIELDEELKNKLEFLEINFDSNDLEHITFLKNFFNDGKIFLNLVDKLAIYIFNTSFACRRYLQIKYKYIIIDEFQDCGNEQYNIFMKLKDLGLKSIAVGDLDQSIYGFTGKSASYLSSLMQNENFTTFSLTRNHRCHSSIINYSLTLMSPNVELLTNQGINIFHRFIPGCEIDIANWIDSTLSGTMDSFGVNSLSNVAILTRGYRTAEIIDRNLNTPHIVVSQSSLEQDNSDVSNLFDNILKFVFEENYTMTEVIELFVSLDTLNLREQKEIKENFISIKNNIKAGNINFLEICEYFKFISNILMPNENFDKPLTILEQVISNELEIYSSRFGNKIQIMTLHKSKGLEFDLVYHLDLYEWILPAKTITNNNQEYISYNQDLNLHYVGITRAKKACVLCTSSKRTNNKNKVITANNSEFLDINNLSRLRR